MFFLRQSHFVSMIPIVRKGIKIDYKLMSIISVQNEPLLSKERIVRHPRHHELNFMKYTTVKRSRFSAEIRKSLPTKWHNGKVASILQIEFTLRINLLKARLIWQLTFAICLCKRLLNVYSLLPNLKLCWCSLLLKKGRQLVKHSSKILCFNMQHKSYLKRNISN